MFQSFRKVEEIDKVIKQESRGKQGSGGAGC